MCAVQVREKWVMGVAVYTGAQSKSVLSAGAPPPAKESVFSHQVREEGERGGCVL
jgi:hypothetical protein